MHRRNLVTAVTAGIGSVLATVWTTRTRASAGADAGKVVYHLTDLDRVNFVLGNIQNHFDGMGGPDKVTIALVIHGPALKAFQKAQANPDITRRIGGLTQSGLALHACGNTMRAQNITVADLLPGFVVAGKGGVVRIAELQAQGYAYLRP